MQQDALECAERAVEKYTTEKDIADFLVNEFDKKHNPTWNCIVRKGNAPKWPHHVNDETKHFIGFWLGQVYILLIKS